MNCYSPWKTSDICSHSWHYDRCHERDCHGLNPSPVWKKYPYPNYLLLCYTSAELYKKKWWTPLLQKSQLWLLSVPQVLYNVLLELKHFNECLLLLLLLLRMDWQCKAESENNQSFQKPLPYTNNWCNEEKEKIAELLLKPAAQAQVGKRKLFINYLRTHISTCTTQN